MVAGFDPDTATPERIAIQFLRRAIDGFKEERGSFAIAYALLQRRSVPVDETDMSVNGDILRLLSMNGKLRDRVEKLEARLEALEQSKL